MGEPGILFHLRELVRFAPVRPAIGAGIRASFATAVPLLAGTLLGDPEAASWGSLGGFLAAIQDKGGAYSDRARAMIAVAVAGALACFAGGLAGRALWIAIPAVLLWVTLCGLARVWGAAASGVGAGVAIIFVVALARPAADAAAAATHGLLVAAGAAWAMLLSLSVWPVRLYQPARAAVAACWRAIGAHARLLARLSGPADTMDERLAIRAAIEEARGVVAATRRGRQAEDPRGERLVVLLEVAEQSLGRLVELGDLLEGAPGGRPEALSLALDELGAACDRVAALVEQPAAERARGAPVVASLRLPPGATPPEQHAARVAGALRRHVEVAWEAAVDIARGSFERHHEVVPIRRPPLLQPLRDNLDPRSEVMRHALRVGITAAVAMLVAWALRIEHGHWIAITVIVILQPYTSATWMRGLQRIAGTVIGAAIAAALAAWLRDPGGILALVFVLSGVSVALLPLNYGIFSAFLTPAFVLLAEAGTGDWGLAWYRILDTVAGGALAFGAAVLLWPRWERQRLPEELAASLRAIAIFLRAARADAPRRELDEARRGVGVALVNADASFQRFLSESSGSAAEVAPFLALLTYARRFHGAAVSLIYAGHTGDEREALASLCGAAAALLDDAADALAGEAAPPELPRLPEPKGSPLFTWQLERVELQLGVLRGAVVRATAARSPP